MELTLQQIVGSALSEAEQSLKLASAMDADRRKDADFATKFAEEESSSDEKDKDKPPVKDKKKSDDEEEEKTAAVEDASHAQELVKALGVVGDLWSKLAFDDPAVSAGSHNTGATVAHTSTSPASVDKATASHGGAPLTTAGGHPNGLKTTMDDYKDPDWTKNRESREGAIRTKGAHPGETKSASAKVLEEQKALLAVAGAKVAQDPSSPQPSGLTTTKDPGKLDLTPPASVKIPDNKGLIDMTKRQAKTDFVKSDAGQLLREPALSAAHDKGISDNLSQGTETAKISGVKLAAAKGLLVKFASGEAGTAKKAAFNRALKKVLEKQAAEKKAMGLSAALRGIRSGTSSRLAQQASRRVAQGAASGGGKAATTAKDRGAQFMKDFAAKGFKS